MQYENAYRSVVQYVGSNIGKDLSEEQVEKLTRKLTHTVRNSITEMIPEAVAPHAEQLFPELFDQGEGDMQQHQRVVPPRDRKQTREEIFAVCAKFFNVDANHPEKKTYWECVCPLNPPPITKKATVGSEINRKVFFAEVDKFVAAGKLIRIDVLTDIAACLSRANQLERYPAPVEVVPPPPPPSARDLHNQQVARDRAMNDPSTSPLKGAKESAKLLVRPTVLTEAQKTALNAKAARDNAIVQEALSRINGYTGYSHSRTYSGRAALRSVFQAAMDEGKPAEEVLRVVEAEANRLAGNSSIR